jgi:hypothetical protein
MVVNSFLVGSRKLKAEGGYVQTSGAFFFRLPTSYLHFGGNAA